MNTVEGNKLIHTWLGKSFETDRSSKVDSLKYHTSWDWLMPVLKKVGSLPVTNESRVLWKEIVEIGLASIEIELTWKLTVKMVEWLNSEKGAQVSDTSKAE